VHQTQCGVDLPNAATTSSSRSEEQCGRQCRTRFLCSSFLALSKALEWGRIWRFNFAKANEQIDQLNDGRPALPLLSALDDLLAESKLAKDMRIPGAGGKLAAPPRLTACF